MDDFWKLVGGEQSQGQGEDFYSMLGLPKPEAATPTMTATQRGTLGAGLKTGVHSALAVGGQLGQTALEAPIPSPLIVPRVVANVAAGRPTFEGTRLVTPKGELLETYKSDPTGFATVWNSPAYAAQRFAEEQQRKASEAQAPENLIPEARERARLEYFTTDPTKSALSSPTRIAGDILASAPSTAATLAAIALTRNPTSGMIAGGVLGAGTEGFAQLLQVREELASAGFDKWQNVPEFKQMVGPGGWNPEMARLYLTEKHATEAGIKSGATAGVLEAIGGRLIGHFAARGASLPKRAGVGATEGIFTEAGEGVEQQVGQNVAARGTVDPARDFWAGVGEAGTQGAVVGGITSSLTNSAIGRRVRQDQQAGEQSVAPPPGGQPKSETRETAEVKAKIEQAALAAGVDPATAIVVAKMESGLNPFVRSAMSDKVDSVGLYQFLPIARKQFGVSKEDLANDVDLQIATGMKLLKLNTDNLVKILGRAPDAHEVYMAQLFGPGGVRYVLQAGPDERILDIVSKYDPANAANVVAWNGMQPSWTRDEVIRHYRNLVQRHMAEVRGGVAPATDEAINRSMGRVSDLDEFDDQLDAILKTPRPDPEKVKAGVAEVQQSAATAPIDPDIQAMLDRAEQARMQPATGLPEGTAEALAARRATTYDRTWAKDNFTQADGAVNAAAALKQLEGDIKEALARGDKAVLRIGDRSVELQENEKGRLVDAQGKPWGLGNILFPAPGEIRQVEIQPQTARADSGVSADEAATRQQTANRNNKARFGDLPVIGKGAKLRETSMAPGEVAIAAHPTEAFPMPYLGVLRDTTQRLASQFVPNARIVLTAQTPDNNAVGFMRRLGGGFYQVNPRNLTRSDTIGIQSTNRTTQLKAAYGLTHELGHVIIDERFREGLDPAAWEAIDATKGLDAIPEDVIASVAQTSPEKAGILREYNARKLELTAPGRTAEDFAHGWLSPWKLSHGIGQGDPKKGWYRFLRNFFLGERAKRADGRTAALAMDADTGILGFHEYAAEQFARYAYNKKLLERTAIGQSGWFKQTFAMLRDLFIQSKKDKLVRANKEFQAWLNELAETSVPQKGAALPVPTRGADAVRFDPDAGIAKENDPLVQETRAIIEARFPGLPAEVKNEVNELLTNGQVEQARELVESSPQQMKPAAFVDAVAGGGTQSGVIGPDGRILLLPGEHADFYATNTKGDYVTVRGFKGSLGMHTPANVTPQQEASGRAVASAFRRAGLGEPVVTKPAIGQGPTIIRWDRDSTVYANVDTFMQQLDKVPAARGATRRWLSTGMRRLLDMGQYFTNLQEFAAKDPFDIGARTVGRLAIDYNERFGRLEQRAVALKERWAKLSSKQDKAMQQLLQEEWKSGEHLPDLQLVQGRWMFVANERFVQAARAAGLDEQTAALFLDVKNEYLFHRNRLQGVIQKDIQRKIDNALMDGREASAAYHTQRLFAVTEAFERIRAQPFLPQTRFGEFLLEVRDGDKVHLEAYESAFLRSEARKKLEKARPDLRRKMRELQTDSTTAVLRVLPLDILDESGMAFGLTAQQRAALTATLDPLTSPPLTRKYSPELAAITGHSRDQLRVFADFMHHDALVTNKLLFRPEFKDALARMREDIEYANQAGDSDRVAEMERRYRQANGYVQQILNPAHEWHTLRAAVVFNQLGFNVKSAVMNLTSIVNTWAAATTRVGQLRGSAELASVWSRTAGDSMARIFQKVVRSPVEGWEAVFSPDERWAMRKAAPFISESFAAQLASFSHQGVLDRLGLTRVKDSIQWVMKASTLPLRLVEEYTRRSTLLTMFNANRIAGMDKESAFERALQDTLLLQGDNSVGGRAPILRGRKSAFLIYFNYTRGMLYLFRGGYEKARRAYESVEGTPKSKRFSSETLKLWMAYAFLGGLMGEPFAEDLDAAMELISKQLFGSRFSLKEHAYEFANWISNNAAEVGLDISPRTIVHGMASDFFGMDVSGSVSLGRALPGAGGIDRLDSRTGQVQALTELLGPLGKPLNTALLDMQRGIPPERPLGFLTPVALQNLLKGMEDEPRFYSGGKILADPKTGEVRKLSDGEQVAQMMGFTPAAIAANREVHWMQQEMRSYWVERRNGLLRQYWEATLQQSGDARYDVMLEMQRFNNEAPGGMRISADQLQRSMRSRQQAARRDERGAPQERALTADYGRVRELVTGQR